MRYDVLITKQTKQKGNHHMSELESTQALDQLTLTQTWQERDTRLSSRIQNLLGNRTLALVEMDNSFNPDTYDPSFDDTEVLAPAA